MRDPLMRRGPQQRVWWRRVGCLLVVLSAGCQTTASPRWLGFVSRPPSASGQPTNAAEPSTTQAQTAAAPLTSISAKGWVSESRGSAAPTIAIELTNRGTIPVLLSYISDEYAATTRDERAIGLEKGDFLNYPAVLSPGETKTVALRLPRDCSLDELVSITAQLSIPKAVVTLYPVAARLSPMGGTTVPVIQPASAMRPVPLLGAAHQFTASLVKPMHGLVPVDVEFRQELGSTLTVRVWWNETGDPIRLADGERQRFDVVPGRHVLCVESELPFVARTRGEVPMVVESDKPVRIVIMARAHLDGVELSVRVWQAGALIAEQVLPPPPTAHAG